MKSKRSKTILIVVAAPFGAGVLFYAFFVRGIVLNIAMNSASSALDSDVKIGDMSFSVLRGRAGIHDIAVANIEGFDSENIITVDRVNVSFAPLSFLSNTLKFKEIEIVGVDVFCQQKGRRNNLLEFQYLISREGKKEDASSKSVSVDIVNIEGL